MQEMFPQRHDFISLETQICPIIITFMILDYLNQNNSFEASQIISDFIIYVHR